MVEKSHPQSRIGSGNSSIRTYRRRPDMFVCRDLFLAVEPSVEQYIQNPGWLSYIGVYTYHTHLYRDYSHKPRHKDSFFDQPGFNGMSQGF